MDKRSGRLHCLCVWNYAPTPSAGRSPLIWRRWLLAATAILVCQALAQPASADEFDVLNFVAGASATHDSNLFRVPDSANPQSDTISTGYVGLRVDKPYAQQRFQLDVTETISKYAEFSYLDFNALSYRGAWLYQLSPRVSGVLSADRTEAQAPFDATTGGGRNIRITENRLFNIDGWVSGGWHALGAVSQSEQTSEAPVQAVPDYRSVSAEAGVRYLAPSGRSITAIQRVIRGKYLDTVITQTNIGSDGYHQNESEIDATWILNGRSTLTGRLVWVERRNDTFIQGDFSGLSGMVGYAWTPTGKLSLDASARRDIGPYVDTFSNSTYQVRNVLSLSPKWQASARITALMNLEYGKNYYRGDAGGPAGGSRRDTTSRALLGVTWAPVRTVTVGASLEHQRYSSNDALFNYDANVANLNVSFTLGLFPRSAQKPVP